MHTITIQDFVSFAGMVAFSSWLSELSPLNELLRGNVMRSITLVTYTLWDISIIFGRVINLASSVHINVVYYAISSLVYPKHEAKFVVCCSGDWGFKDLLPRSFMTRISSASSKCSSGFLLLLR